MLALADRDEHLNDSLDAALLRVPLRLREAVILRYLEGRAMGESAVLSGLPQALFARRARRGLTALHSELEAQGVPVSREELRRFLSREPGASISPRLLLALRELARKEWTAPVVLPRRQPGAFDTSL